MNLNLQMILTFKLQDLTGEKQMCLFLWSGPVNS
jgi:hypothetical protein